MATFVQHEKITYEYIQKKANDPTPFALLCSTNWCRYCPRAVKLFEKLRNEQKDIEFMILKDMEKTLFKQLHVTSYPTFIVYSNGKQIYKGHDGAAFCKSLGIKYEKKIRRRQDGSYYRLSANGEEQSLSTHAAQRLKSYYGEEDDEENDEENEGEEPDHHDEIHTDGQGRQFKLTCDGDICRKVYI